MTLLRILLASLVLAFATPVFAALDPAEVLDDPVLEQRARGLSTQLRCMVCQNQSIDDSNAELARDLRILVRERLVEGDTDEEVIQFVVSRYGEYVLLQPLFNARNAILWGAPILLLLAGGGFIYASTRKRRAVATAPALSDEESRRLREILRDAGR